MHCKAWPTGAGCAKQTMAPNGRNAFRHSTLGYSVIPAPSNRLVGLNYCQASRRPAAASRLRCAGVVFLVDSVAPWPIIAASGSTASHLHPTNSAGMQLQFHDLIVSIKDRFALTPSRTVFSGAAKVRCRCVFLLRKACRTFGSSLPQTQCKSLFFTKKAVIFGGLCAGFVLASQSGDAESIADSVNAV